jgi:hypothetical protein
VALRLGAVACTGIYRYAVLACGMSDAHQARRSVLQALFKTANVLPMASTTAAASTINKSFMARLQRGVPDYSMIPEL